MIVAAIALVLAMAGTAIAGPGAVSNKITRSKVKYDRRQADRQGRAESQRGQRLDTADRAKIASNIFSANVLGDGMMLGSIPAGATSTQARRRRLLRVNFGRNLAGCTISASLANNVVPRSGWSR